MKNLLPLVALAAGSLALAACGEDKPPTVVHETRVVHHYHTQSQPRTTTSDNPDNFEPVERPASYSR